MTSKLTVYIDDSTRKLLNEYRGEKSLSQIVNDALDSYIPAGLVRDLSLPAKELVVFPSLSEVVKRRPRASGSSAEIIASHRKGRNARLS